MTLVPTSKIEEFPAVFSDRVNGPAFISVTLDAADEAAANIFQIVETGTCIGARFVTRIVITGETFTVSLQTVSVTTGDPTGTLYHANATQTIVIADTDDNTELAVTWTGFTVTEGDIVALVITAPASGTFDVDLGSFLRTSGQIKFPYRDEFASAAWTKITSNTLLASIEYSGGVFHAAPQIYLYEGITSSAFNSSSTPDEWAVKFIMPIGLQVRGAWVLGDFDEAFDIILRDAGDTPLGTISVDKDIRSSIAPGAGYYWFSGAIELTKDATYRLSIIPTTTTSIRLYSFECAGVAQLSANSPGPNITKSTREGGGSWDEFNAHIPAGLLYDAVDIPAGGGAASILGAGGMLHGGMD